MDTAATLGRRLTGAFVVDEWGLDRDLVDLLAPLGDLRWSVEVQWPERIPAEGPALLVHNRRAGFAEVAVLAQGLRRATGRHVRFVGVPDLAPVGPALRRLGGVLDRPDEVAGLLRAGQVVAIPAGRHLRRGVGGLDPAALEPAVDTGAAVHAVALHGHELGRSWRVLVGPAVAVPQGVGPLSAPDLVDEVRADLRTLLAEVR